MKKDRYFYQIWWVWLIIVGLIVVSFLILLIDCEEKANIIAIVGAWISGIATIFIGVIATRQNKKYKEDNDDFNSKQLELIKKQHDLEEYKNIINFRTDFVISIKNELDVFCKNYDFGFVTSRLAHLLVFAGSNSNSDDMTDMMEIIEFSRKFKSDYIRIKASIINDWYKTSENAKLCESLDAYYINLASAIHNLNLNDISSDIYKINKEITLIQIELFKHRNKYIEQLEKDLKDVLLSYKYSVNELKNHYHNVEDLKNGKARNDK